MIEYLTQEQKDRLFERLITNASDILSEELGMPRRTFQELKELLEHPNPESEAYLNGENSTIVVHYESEHHQTIKDELDELLDSLPDLN